MYNKLYLAFFHALMMLRRGVRYGQSQPILAAKSKLVLLFFGRNHLRYQEIVSHGFRIECMIPNEVKQCMHLTFSMSRNGKDGHYQGGDVIIEEINKLGKKWIIDVPTEMQWQRSFRNLDVVEVGGRCVSIHKCFRHHFYDTMHVKKAIFMKTKYILR